MLVILYLLLMITEGRFTDDRTFATETVDVGGDVTLTCPRPESSYEYDSTFHWIRLVSGNWPEFLGGTYGFDDSVNKTPHITAKQEPGAFLLHISQTKLSDTGFYYCIEVKSLHITFLNGTFLRVKGPEPDITAVIQVSPSDPVHSGDSVTIQCSVLSDSEDKTCPGDHRVYWFRPKSDESHPSLIYTHENNTDRCERNPETHSQKCVYSFSKDVSSSDAGTYYCAVATCGEILFGNGAKLDIKGINTWDVQKDNIVVSLLCVALVTSLIVITFLIYTIKKNNHDDASTQSQQRDESAVVYSAPNIIMRETGKAERKNAQRKKEKIIYSDVRA
ncbi:signal-regulatory protein beta-2-like [Mugil cephalus]|uniref:signal-regulatory protein beta-2-like n=1 Tax=Mugil cephalus TaxID=48193 RepID=UPI001FB76A9B|nr:signal-regulatory protein beta-2-like [Mugil cephalus]